MIAQFRHYQKIISALAAFLFVLPSVCPADTLSPAQHPDKRAIALAKARVAVAKRTLTYVSINKQNYILLKDLAKFYGLRHIQPDSKKTHLLSKHSKLVFSLNSRIFTFNGITANLSYPVASHQGQLALSTSDTLTLIDPILRVGTISKRNIKHIVIDAGHGGNDPGAQSGSAVEKNLNLLIARRTAAILAKRGYNVTVTRMTDKELSLQQRVDICKKLKPDLFLSFHCNATGDTSIKGIETFIPNPKGTPSSGGNTVAKNAAASDVVVKENALLGYLLQTNLLKQTKASDRGLKRKQFFVIRGQSCPSALIEVGFLTNATERANITTYAYMDKLAVAVCDAVQDFDAKLKPKQAPQPR